MSNQIIIRSKEAAEKKLEDLFKTKIISKVFYTGKDYVIEYLSAKENYNNCVESQKEMKGYLDYLKADLFLGSEDREEEIKKITKQIKEDNKKE